MIAQRLKSYLEEQGVKYSLTEHLPAYSASDVASAAHVPPRDFAKAVIVKIGGTPAMVVIPASRRLMIHDLREMFDNEHLTLATESEIRRWFPDCEVGAMPPFGNLYWMRVYIVPSLANEAEISFNAGTHTDVITMEYADYKRIVQPRIIDLLTTAASR